MLTFYTLCCSVGSFLLFCLQVCLFLCCPLALLWHLFQLYPFWSKIFILYISHFCVELNIFSFVTAHWSIFITVVLKSLSDDPNAFVTSVWTPTDCCFCIQIKIFLVLGMTIFNWNLELLVNSVTVDLDTLSNLLTACLKIKKNITRRGNVAQW